MMKKTSFLISTARGGIHDEAALIDALHHGEIAGAGVDVFLKEPPPADHPLLMLDTVVATPHIAGLTVEARQGMAQSAARQWIALLDGRAPFNVVNAAAWARYCERFEALFGQRPVDAGSDG
jgi:D-3-phosphoglycerate dehydrogenase / 2-oxoglutarate reductase